MNRRDILKVVLLGTAGALIGLRPVSTDELVADKSLESQIFTADDGETFIGYHEAVSVGRGCHHSCAKIVSRTDSTITVEAYNGSDPIFVKNGVVSTRNFIRTDSEIFLRQAWFTVHNYRPNEDGTQTWDINLVGGDISDIVVQGIAYHYGAVSDYEDTSVYEVAGSSGWQL